MNFFENIFGMLILNFSRDMFEFSCCLQQILQIFCNHQRWYWFCFSDDEGFFVCIFDHCEDSKNIYVFLLLQGNTSLPMFFCIANIHIRAWITWWTAIFIWVLGVGFHVIILYNFIFCGVSKINNLLNKLLSVIWRVFHSK